MDEDFAKSIDFSIPAPALSPLVSLATGLMVLEAINIITKITSPKLTNCLTAFHYTTFTINTIEHWQRDKYCLVCGNDAA